MSAQHTHGQLRVTHNNWEASTLHCNGIAVAHVLIESDVDEQTQQHLESVKEANASRLAACWNACEGVPTEFLEEHPAPFSEMRAERDKLLADVMELERQRDTMLTALNAAKRLFDEALPKFNWGASALDANAIRLLNDVPLVVQEAIAKTGGAA